MTEKLLFEQIDLYKKRRYADERMVFALDGGEQRAFVVLNEGVMLYQNEQDYSIGVCVERTADENSSWDDSLLLAQGILLEFCDRQDLDKEDYALIKSLERSYRGRGQWPRLRKLHANRVPWYLAQEDVQAMTQALRAANHVLQNGELSRAQGDCLAVVTPTGDGFALTTQPIAPPIPDGIDHPAADIDDEMFLARLKRMPKHQSVWDVTVQAFPYPTDAGDGGAPVYPQMMMLVDESSDTVLDLVVTNQEGGNGAKELLVPLSEQIIELGRPRLIRCANDKSTRLIQLLCQGAGIPIERTDRLPLLKEAFDSLLSFGGEDTDEE